MTIGIISYQGDVDRHERALAESREGVSVRRVRRPEELAGLAGIVIPGGESTTIGMLMERFGLLAPLREAIAAGLPVLGTCAGAILLAREIEGSSQVRLGTLDIGIRRNAYGRQIDSFEADLEIPELGAPPLRAVFIRAPRIERVGSDIEVLATFEGAPVLIRQGATIALSFHPELTDDRRVQQLFLETAVARVG